MHILSLLCGVWMYHAAIWLPDIVALKSSFWQQPVAWVSTWEENSKEHAMKNIYYYRAMQVHNVY